MDLSLLLENLKNPSLLFFVLGILSVYLKSDLEIPPSSSKFISLYLLLCIGFKGGQELSHETLSVSILYCLLFGVLLALVIPIYTFFILKRRFNVYDAAAVAAAYGSVSAVTFVTATNYLELKGMQFNGYMVAVMALMESPAIIAGLLLFSFYGNQSNKGQNKDVLRHSVTNGSVLLIIGSLVVGYFTSTAQAEGIKPFTNDIFKGFLAIFLLDMGIVSGKKLSDLFHRGWYPFAFGLLVPLLNGCVVAFLSHFVTDDVSNRFIFSILAASASYIAVPAAMKIALPQANPGIYLPMALGITFPVNITIGFPIYYCICVI